MALNLANFFMAHSVKVSIMPNMSKNQDHVSNEAVDELHLERQPIFAAAGLPIAPLNLLTDTQKVFRKRKLGSEFLN